MAALAKVNAALDTADKAANLIKKVAGTESSVTMGAAVSEVSFSKVVRTAVHQQGLAPNKGALQRNIINTILDAIKFHDTQVQMSADMVAPQIPNNELFSDNDEIERALSVINIKAPTGAGFISAFSYEESEKAPGKFYYMVRVAAAQFEIKNDYCIITKKKSGFLKSSTTSYIQELPTGITMERWNAITNVLLGGEVQSMQQKQIA